MWHTQPLGKGHTGWAPQDTDVSSRSVRHVERVAANQRGWSTWQWCQQCLQARIGLRLLYLLHVHVVMHDASAVANSLCLCLCVRETKRLHRGGCPHKVCVYNSKAIGLRSPSLEHCLVQPIESCECAAQVAPDLRCLVSSCASQQCGSLCCGPRPGLSARLCLILLFSRCSAVYCSTV